jgi:hypothetical protein
MTTGDRGPVLDLSQVAAFVAAAWSGRPASQRTHELATLSHSTEPALTVRPSDVAEQLRRRAALSGSVTPRDLVRGVDDDQAALALDLLAPEFDRTHTASGWRWVLGSTSRRRVLAELAAADAVTGALADVSTIPTDPAGQALRQVLSACAAEPAVTTGVEPATVLQALTWAAPVGGLAGDLAEARRVRAVTELTDSYAALLRYGVYGRDAELARLREFAEGPAADPAYGPAPVQPVTGIGGSGKSTVLAALVRPYLDRIRAGDHTGPAVVVIDFDRVLFRAQAQLELSFEFTRQLGWAAPEAGADFSVLRSQTRWENREVGIEEQYLSRAVESESSSSFGFESAAGLLARMHGLSERPVVLVLDTFEEWQRERPWPEGPRTPWNDPGNVLSEWLNDLRYGMGLQGLRVVVSGRAGPSKQLGADEEPLRLGDLASGAALALVRQLGVPDTAGPALVGLVGGNPLTLRVAVRFFLKLPPAEREAFLRGDPTETGLNEELRRVVLYERFLEHIEGDQVKQLAHPGLVLRRVTPELVRYVLAPHVGLGDVDDALAVELTDRLADEVWLVRETPEGLRHHPDVRRAMLAMMIGDEQYAAQIQAIHRAAADWYGSSRDGTLTGEAAEVEWFYHSLNDEYGRSPFGRKWAEELAAPEPAPRWGQLAGALGEADVAGLPAPLRTLVKVLRDDALSPAETDALPDPVWARCMDRRGPELIAADEADLAFTLALRRIEARPGIGIPPWLAEAAVGAARWDEYWPVFRRSRRSTPIGPADSTPSTAGRYAFLAALVSPSTRNLTDYFDELPPYVARMGRSDGPPRQEMVFADLLCAFGVPGSDRFGMAPPSMIRDIRGDWLDDPDLFPVDQFRRLLCWSFRSDAERRPFVLHRIAGLLRPDPRWVEDFVELTGSPRYALDPYLDRLAKARDLAHRLTTGGLPQPELLRLVRDTAEVDTHTLLGETSLVFSRSVGDDMRLKLRSVRAHPELLWVLRGDNPEFRPAIRLALAEHVAADRLGQLGRFAWELLPVPAADLHTNALPPGSSPDARKTLVRLVEYVDRSGVLQPFLARCRDELPPTPLLDRVTRAFTVWDDAHARMLAAVADWFRQ